MSAWEECQQLALRCTDPIQHDDEVIRGIMLADETITERSRITGVDRDTISERARRFVQHGMFGLGVRSFHAMVASVPYISWLVCAQRSSEGSHNGGLRTVSAETPGRRKRLR